MNDSLKVYARRIIDNSPLIIRHTYNFRKIKGRWPHLLFPRDYCDFIARDNIFGRHNKHAYLADKLEVRKYVDNKGLSGILVPLLGYWDSADKVDFDTLPNQFAIKCNHSCGMNIICYDKSKLDIEESRKKLDFWMHSKHPKYFEQHYNHIKPMILAEALIPSNADGFFPPDYKIHCANGEPVFIQCCFERTDNDAGRRVIYSPQWENLHFIINDSHYTDAEVEKPKHLKEMLECASVLSKGLEYARVDLYDTDKGVVFGEITLTPMGGWLSYFKQEALDIMGKAIRKNRKND
jgi:hypothetical protein